jgi:hypothetical protein
LIMATLAAQLLCSRFAQLIEMITLSISPN